MKIISWNIYLKNKNIQKAIAFLKNEQADIICLQEFPAKYLDLLKTLDCHIALCDEMAVYKNTKKPATWLYTVIISKFPIKSHTIIAHKKKYENTGKMPKRYHYFQADSSYIDIDTEQGAFRIFNTHLKCVAGPTHRLSQFKEVIEHLSPERKNIICGDFNTFGRPLVNILLWKFYGYKAHELKINETKDITALFEAHGLKNPLQKQVTFLKFPVQLDYILVPENMEVKAKKTFLHPHGSDHFPLLLEI